MLTKSNPAEFQEEKSLLSHLLFILQRQGDIMEESIHFQIRALLIAHPLKIRESSILEMSQQNFREITLYDLYYYTDDLLMD